MPGSKGTILVVDDEPDSLALLTGILTEEGYQVRPADSGKLALASAAATPPELILLDLRMPGMDGLEVCRQLKAHKETRDIPILFLSAAADREERVEGLASGAVDFLGKPLFRPELLARVRTHLELSRLRSKLETQIARRTDELVLTVKRLHKEIAERERSVQALRESEQRFRTVADTAPMMIVASDAHQQATFFNKAWLDFTGRALEQELGTGWISSLHPEDADGAFAALAASYESRGECRLEYRLRRADGEYRSIICRGVPRFEPDGTLAGYIGSAVDITEIKQSQEAALARQKLESLGVLASGIAHDFNNLLGGIIAEAELLSEEPQENPGTRESARKIEAVALRASEIVRQLMAYAGQETAGSEPVDLAALVREMLELVKVSISKSAELKVEIPGKLPLIQANAAQIRQVVLNLITNASEALGEKKGVISVTAEQIRLRPSPEQLEADYLRLEVSDTGSGMPERVLAKIFDPYFSTKAAGRGLGLAAVQGIIRSHRGSITVVSTAGQGSRFSILLPAATGAALVSRGVEIRAAVHRGGSLMGTVLVIEDEDALRLALAKVLRRSGLTVFDAADGKTGLDLFRAHAPEIGVVLMDLTLPGVSGPEVFSELQQIRPEVKVIITSAYSQDWALGNLGGRQPWLYIRKPYHLRELVEILRNAGMDKGLGQASG